MVPAASDELETFLQDGFQDGYDVTELRPLGSWQSHENSVTGFQSRDNLVPRGQGVETRNEPSETVNGIETGLIHRDDSILLDVSNTQSKLWNPLWLHRITLIGFVLLFNALALALVLLWHFSTVNHGFGLLTTNHYAWTYGPTAVLVMIVSCWRQIDFWCKTLAPWQELMRSSPASKGILLDYLSPLQTASFWRAVKNGHIPVITTILGFTLLKLITIISTGLFLVSSAQMPLTSIALTAKTVIDASEYNSSVYYTGDTSSVYTAYALINKHLPYPEGTKPECAYQAFQPVSNDTRSNSTISAVVDAFYPHLYCEVADIHVNLPTNDTSDDYSEMVINATSPSCQKGDFENGISRYTIPIKNPGSESCPPRQLSGYKQWANCSDIDDFGWSLLTMADYRYNQTLANGSTAHADQNVKTVSSSTSVSGISGIFCRLSYSIERARVTYDFTQSQPAINVEGPLTQTNATLRGFSNLNISMEFNAAFQAAITMFGSSIEGDQDLELPDTLSKMMAVVSGGGYVSLLNPKVMSKAAEVVFQNTAAQIANKNFVRKADVPLQGLQLRSTDRLHIRTTALWLMFSGFLIMAVLSATVLLVRPRDVVPRSPETLGSIALILARSKGVGNILLDISGSKSSAMRSVLSSHRFQTHITTPKETPQVFSIAAVDSRSQNPTSNNATRSSKWWRPFPAHWPVVTLMLCLPLILIVLLEVLQQLSNHHKGIVSLPNASGFTLSIYSRYLPALVMLMVATMYNSLDFTVSSLAPLWALKRANVNPDQSIMSSLIGRIPVHALYIGISHKHWSAVFSTTSALLGSVLTIIVSGLYTIDNVSAAKIIQLQRLDHFTTEWNNSVVSDNLAGVVVSLTESLNLTYPQFTYEELAFPTFSIGSFPKSTVSTDQLLLNAQVPALRASLNCSAPEQKAYNVSASYDIHTGLEASIEARASLPSNCLLGGEFGNLTYMEWGEEFTMSSTNGGYIGSLIDLHVGPWSEIYESSEGESDSGIQGDNPPGCPSLAFIFGYIEPNNTAKSNVTTMMCYQLMEEVQTNVTFNLPDLSIATAHPPIPIESTARYLPSGSHGETAFEYRLQTHLESEVSIFNQTEFPSDSISSQVFPFFQAVLLGKYPVDPLKLLGPDNQRNLMDAVQGVYRRYMAQVISANMRLKSDASDPNPEIYNGTTMDPDNPRLKQNNASKITLQILLGFMVVCGSLAYALTSTRYLVPHEPYSIAGAAALLAGSKMCASDSAHDYIPDGAEWMSDKELRRSGVWQGKLFSLGWWEDRESGRRRYGIDVGHPERS